MHRKLFVVFAWLVIFAMTISSTALARPELPPILPDATETYSRPSLYPSARSPQLNPSSAFAAEDGLVTAQAIAVGKPVAFNYEFTFGETSVAYFDDAEHLNGVTGMLVDNDGNVYVSEEGGARVLKFAPDGTRVWQAGIAGLHDRSATGFFSPRELAFGPDANLWVGDNEVITRVDPANGQVLSAFPEKPWEVEQFLQFSIVSGIAFDDAGHVYLADRNRQRVQVLNVAPDGTILGYQAVIGTTDEWGSDNNHFNNPAQVVVDAGGNLYVADMFNHRVQQCAPDATFTQWDCDVFLGVSGESGNDATHLSVPYALMLDGDELFITDNANDRVMHCDDLPLNTACTEFVTGLSWPSEVARDPEAGVFVSSYGDHTVKLYSAAGALLENAFAGTLGEPYVTDARHFNTPRGLDVDAKGAVYLVEDWGNRLIKLSALGDPLWVKGIAGIGNGEGNDPDTFQSPTAVAVDPTGKKVAVATNGWVVRLYNAATGDFLSNINKDEQNYRFDFVTGLAFDKSGNLYVADGNVHVVRMYNKLGVYVRTLGVSYEWGRDNAHFNNPAGLAIDASGNLFVADRNNCRVQKFDKNGKFLMTVGTTRCGGEYDRMGGPMDVALDKAKNIYVAEEWNSRVSVYNAAGAYLGTIAGNWSDGSGGLKNPISVAIDNKGKVYVADMFNSRVQRFALGVPYAAKVSLDNFGTRQYNEVWALGFFKGQLYAGSGVGSSAQIWRQTKTGWEAVMTEGFDDGWNIGIDSLYEYKGYLYATTANCGNPDCSISNGGQIWRSPDGATWQPVEERGFGNNDNVEVFRLAKLGNRLCASTWTNGHGSEMWCSESGDPDTWFSQITPGFGNANNLSILTMQEYNGAYFAGTINTTDGAGLYRKTATTNWQPLPFPAGNHIGVSDMVVFKSSLYVLMRPLAGMGELAQIWRCKLCDGSAGDWVQVDNAFDSDDMSVVAPSMKATKTALYAVLGNREKGLSVWMSKDGVNWTQISTNGLGNSHNMLAYWGNGTVANSSNLYIGVVGSSAGSSIWKVCSSKSCK